MAGVVKLKAIEGPVQGRTFAFDEHDTFIFGRAEDCHVQLPEQDTTVSRHHFILEVNPPDARIRDLASRNGTFINKMKFGGRSKDDTPEQAAKRRFPETAVKDGDEIRAGDSVFTVEVQVPVSETPSQSEPPRCSHCFKNVSEEIGKWRSGHYICESCQANSEADPAALLLKLFRIESETRGEAPAPGIPGYTLGKLLGKGGMGAVYLARREKDNAEVAVKVMLSKIAVDENSKQAFLREIEIGRSLHHENCVELFDHGILRQRLLFRDGVLSRRQHRSACQI